MDSKRDIESRIDIERILFAFYKKVLSDELIAHFFTKVVPLDLETHIPVITDFWETVVLNTQTYRKNVMEVHQRINQLSSIKKEHLDRWVKTFAETIDENFEGENATLMKHRARSIATLMDIKLNHGLIS